MVVHRQISVPRGGHLGVQPLHLREGDLAVLVEVEPLEDLPGGRRRVHLAAFGGGLGQVDGASAQQLVGGMGQGEGGGGGVPRQT